ncbi:MAG: hypothetical protein R3A79_17590 [Nannocystaceae bacterium]
MTDGRDADAGEAASRDPTGENSTRGQEHDLRTDPPQGIDLRAFAAGSPIRGAVTPAPRSRPEEPAAGRVAAQRCGAAEGLAAASTTGDAEPSREAAPEVELSPAPEDAASARGSAPRQDVADAPSPGAGASDREPAPQREATAAAEARTRAPPRRPRSLRGPIAAASTSGADRHERAQPWTRVLLGLAIVGPPLAIGGALPSAVVGFLAVALVLWIRLCRRTRGWLELPWATWLGVGVVAITALQCLPLPAGLREALAPGVVHQVTAALAGTGVDPWPSLSPTPADTALEVARLVGLTALFVVAAQLPWRVCAGLVAAAGAAVAGAGLLHEGLGMRKILGLYAPLDIDPAATPALLTTFVNPNHQADLFLLALFAAAGLLVRMRLAAREAASPELKMMLWSTILVVGAALLLSLSRGALLALALAAPPALLIAWLSGQDDDASPGRGGRRRRRWLARLVVAGLVAGAAAALARAGAWDELLTLRNPGQGPADKLRIAEDALALHDLAPALGVGRGAFMDLFPAVDSAPTAVLHTHLESAPATLWVEWGHLGIVLGLGLLAAFVDAMRRAGGRSDAAARRVALCGLAAVAIHSVGDFSLEFIGVAAPAVALAGALAGHGRRWPVGGAGLVGGVLLAASLGLAIVVAPHTWTAREAADRALAATDARPEAQRAALARRPLDVELHRSLARAALLRGDARGDADERAALVADARHHARVASALRPADPDVWLLRAAAESRGGGGGGGRASLRRALAALDGPPSPALATYLLSQVEDPAALAPLLPEDPARWSTIVEALVAVDPPAALAVATARADAPTPASAPILEAQASAALYADNPALAIHYARLLARAAPDRASAHILLMKALERSRRPRGEEIRGHLREAIRGELIRDPAELGLLEEALVERLLDAAQAGDAAALAEARALLPTLRKRPGERAALQRRHALERRAEDLAAIAAPPADGAAASP